MGSLSEIRTKAEDKVKEAKQMNSVLTCSILGPCIDLQMELLGRHQEKIVLMAV